MKPASHCDGIQITARWREIGIALAAILITFGLVPRPAAFFLAALAVLALIVAVIDLRSFIIPDSASALIFALGLGLIATATRLDWLWTELGDALLRALVGGGTLQLLRLGYRWKTGDEGLGFGDVKLATAGAPWLGWQMMPVALEIATLAAILVISVRALSRREKIDRHLAIPFGVFLAPAIWIVAILEHTLA